MDEHEHGEYLRAAYRAAGQEWRPVNEAAHAPSPEDLEAAYRRARDAALAALAGAGLDGDEDRDAAREEFWLEAARLAPRRLMPGTEYEDDTEPEDTGDGEPAPDWRQDISDPATGLSRMLSERCATCILRPGDPMHLGPERTAAFIRQVLDVGSYVVCHDTLTYGDFPEYGPAICRGFFDAYRDRSRDLLILRAGRRLTEVPPPIVAKAEELGRDAGKAAASQVFDGNTPDEACQRVLRGVEDGAPAALDATEPPAIGPAAGYTEDDLARDLGIDLRDRALPRAVSAYADAFTGSFWQETVRASRDHSG